MLEGLLIALITVLAVIVAVKVLYILMLLAAMIISGIFRLIGLLLRGVYLLVLRPAFWIVSQIITLPVRLAGLILRPMLPAAASGVELGTACRNGACRCANPAAARFCRRCGVTIAAG